ncbi:hypothetical protein AVEN_231755-1 [Araneus ventricosus]|uniref:Uncharacterized protein n=1 Tax=Araneus ventricosus TaxID=182803 RepID=A0A4Y2SR22_ARAVE|nr:hypothetical protein AVEN_231755-1 [Araneus ventricosus]
MQNKTWCIAAFLALCILHNLAWSSESAETPSYYTAAVFEHVQTQNCTTDPEQAKEVLKFNVDFFSQVARIAKSKVSEL